MKSLVKALISGLDNRSTAVLTDDQYYEATMLIPKFTMRFLPESEKYVKKAFLVATVSATTKSENNMTTAGPVQALQGQQGTDITAVYSASEHGSDG